MQVVRGALAEIAVLPLEKAVRKLIATAVDAHRLDPRLHRVLAEQIPRTGAAGEDRGLQSPVLRAVPRVSRAAPQGTARRRLGLAAFVCVTSIEALTHTAVLHRPEMLTDEAVGTLVDEATRLVMRYLR